MNKSIVISLCFLLLLSNITQADPTVQQGHDLYETGNSTINTTFGTLNIEFALIGDFDFGDGDEDVGNADTIIERKEPATVANPGETDTIDIEIVELQLKSVEPIDLGSGLDFHYVTPQTGVPNIGTMDITFDDFLGGTIDLIVDFFFDLRIGAIDGTIITSGVKTFSAIDVPWAREYLDEDPLLLPGVNHMLNGLDTTEDFWVPSLTLDAGDGSVLQLSPATPEPATILLLGIGAMALRRRK